MFLEKTGASEFGASVFGDVLDECLHVVRVKAGEEIHEGEFLDYERSLVAEVELFGVFCSQLVPFGNEVAGHVWIVFPDCPDVLRAVIFTDVVIYPEVELAKEVKQYFRRSHLLSACIGGINNYPKLT